MATTKRRKREYEDAEYYAMLLRMIRAGGRRAATNPEALAYLHKIQADLTATLDAAGQELLSSGQWSQQEVANQLTEFGARTRFGKGWSQQAVEKRWGRGAIRVQLAAVKDIIDLAAVRRRKAAAAAAGKEGARDAM